MTVRALLFDFLSCQDEILGILVMLLHSSGDCQYVQVKDDILWGEVDLLEQVVCSDADLDFVLERSGLACLIEGHDDDSSAILLDQTGLSHEVFFSFLERDTVNNTFTLALLESSFDDVKFRRINHDWHRCDIGI